MKKYKNEKEALSSLNQISDLYYKGMVDEEALIELSKNIIYSGLRMSNNYELSESILDLSSNLLLSGKYDALSEFCKLGEFYNSSIKDKNFFIPTLLSYKDICELVWEPEAIDCFIKLVLDRKFLDKSDLNGNSLLHIAAYKGNYELFEALCFKGADVHLTNARSDMAINYLFDEGLSLDEEDLSWVKHCIKMCLDKPCPNAYVQKLLDEQLSKMVSKSAKNNDRELMEFLLNNGANFYVEENLDPEGLKFARLSSMDPFLDGLYTINRSDNKFVIEKTTQTLFSLLEFGYPKDNAKNLINKLDQIQSKSNINININAISLIYSVIEKDEIEKEVGLSGNKKVLKL